MHCYDDDGDNLQYRYRYTVSFKVKRSNRYALYVHCTVQYSTVTTKRLLIIYWINYCLWNTTAIMAKDVSKLMLVIEDETLWDTMLDHSESRLVVIDLHQEWCGYCDAIHPSISRMFLDYDECEARFLYCSASIGKLGAKIQPFLPTDSHIDLVKNGCLPLFALVRVSIAQLFYHLYFMRAYILPSIPWLC